MTTPDIEEAVARAYDAEDAAQRGEPSPWDVPFEDERDYEQFRAERVFCARAALAAIPRPVVTEEMVEAGAKGLASVGGARWSHWTAHARACLDAALSTPTPEKKHG